MVMKTKPSIAKTKLFSKTKSIQCHLYVMSKPLKTDSKIVKENDSA